MRKGIVYYKELEAGTLTETDDGDFIFQYSDSYVENYPDHFITFTMPVTSTPYINNRLFPFFEGLIPEGWLLDIASKNWKMNQSDKMGLLLACCQNCIGAVSVLPIPESDGE